MPSTFSQPFWFHAAWFTHKDFILSVEANWHGSVPTEMTLEILLRQ